jgi:glycosyltransferase involved in cell wall biosynthesis
VHERRLVSIVINNYNYAPFLRAAIDSALAQDHAGTEVIVVDDGSTDASGEIIASCRDKIIPVLKANGGQASAFNAGFAASRGEVIIFLDADDTLLPTAAATALRLFDDRQVVKVHWPLWIIDENGRRTGEVMPQRPLAEGDLRAAVIHDGPDSQQGVPTSGNAWSRRLLAELLPAPEPEYRQGADGYLLTLAPLYGLTRKTQEPQGCYRVHGSNQYWCAATDERIERSLVRYERRSATLSQRLANAGVDHDAAAWKSRNPYYRWLHRMQRTAKQLRAIIPSGAKFLLADENQWGANPLGGRCAVPFTEKDGCYWGPPASDAEAVREFERLRSAGAEFMVFGWPAFWWLEHYPSLRHHLTTNFQRRHDDDNLIVFELRQPKT